MKIDVRKAAVQDIPTFCNLWEFYIYDFSEMNDFDVDEYGRYGDPPEHYWTKPHHFPFLIYADEKLAGFMLVRRNEPIQIISQFFVMLKYRKKGIGRQAAIEAFQMYPGK